MNTRLAVMNTKLSNERRPFGEQLREWRQRRHLSQLDLAGEVDISTRHLSFVETGRSTPSRAMVLRLAERLSVPLRERNALLVSAGFAPMYSTHALSDPELASARAAIELVLKGHEPYPALLVDRSWNLVSANRVATAMMVGIDESLLAPPVNVLRVTLHPKGLAPRIENLAQWHAEVVGRVQRELEITADENLRMLLEELRGYPTTNGLQSVGVSSRGGNGGGGVSAETSTSLNGAVGFSGVVVPMRLRSPAGVLTLFSTTTVFGTAVEVTLSELTLEAFYPADEFTAEVLRGVAAAAS
jgi:transcriptional regulator with XRE-family HTH domain